LRRFYWNECVRARQRAEKDYFRKLGVILKSFLSDPALIAQAVQRQFRLRILRNERETQDEVRKELSRLGLDVLLPEE
jgi:hypothetical protein